MSATWQHVFVIYRLDDYLDAEEMANRIVIKEVLPGPEEAQYEVDRLNRLSDGSFRYFWQSAKYYPEGRCAGDN